jgi:hypothetical protein
MLAGGACSWAKARATGYSARSRSGRPLFGEALVREAWRGTWCRSQCRRGGVRRVLPRGSMRPVRSEPALGCVAMRKSAPTRTSAPRALADVRRV